MGEVDSNSAVKGMSEGVGLYIAAKDLLPEDRNTILCGCKAMLLRTGTGNVTHPRTQQLWAQGACGVAARESRLGLALRAFLIL